MVRREPAVSRPVWREPPFQSTGNVTVRPLHLPWPGSFPPTPALPPQRKRVRSAAGIRAVAETKADYAPGADTPKADLARLVRDLERQMKAAAKDLEFEKAAMLRDQIIDLRKVMVSDDALAGPAA